MQNEKHDIFVNAIKPYPFNQNGSKSVYVKILETQMVDEGIKNEQTFYQISIINQNMLDYDYEFFSTENLLHDNNYYRPYFYEFITKVENPHHIWYLNIKAGFWLEAEFVDSNSSSKEQDGYISEYFIEGIVFFSASPFQIEKRTLCIKNTPAPDYVISKLKRTYATNASKISMNESKHASLKNWLHSHTDGDDFRIKVYNVCQGNGIYIYDNSYNRILFDIGFSCNPYSSDWGSRQQKIVEFIYSKVNPSMVILSHWDMDHIIGVCFASLNLFDKKWIAPDLNELPESGISIGAARLAKYLHWKNSLTLIDSTFNNEAVFINNSSGFEIWRGKGKRLTLNKANNYGLIIMLNTEKSVLLPGDCEYEMLPDCISLSKKRYDYLIVPHHCSKMKKMCSYLPKVDDINYAIISVGENSYIPQHPVQEHINFLENVLRYTVLETKDVKYFIEIPSTQIMRCCIR